MCSCTSRTLGKMIRRSRVGRFRFETHMDIGSRAGTVISELNVRITTVKVIWESRDGRAAARQNRSCERNCVLNLERCLPGLCLNFPKRSAETFWEHDRTASGVLRGADAIDLST
jgi:hypothetical protein